MAFSGVLVVITSYLSKYLMTLCNSNVILLPLESGVAKLYFILLQLSIKNALYSVLNLYIIR